MVVVGRRRERIKIYLTFDKVAEKTMFTKQFKMTSIAAMVALAGMAVSAQAASVTGEFQISAARTTLDATDDSIDFAPDGSQFVFISTTAAFGGDFHTIGFMDAQIYDVTSISQNTTEELVSNFFLDLGTIDIFSVPPLATVIDGMNTFTLTDAGTLEVKQSGGNVAIDFFFDGTFHITGFDPTPGSGNLTFQVNNTTETAVNNALAGSGVSNLTFSGGAFTTSVPGSPTSIPAPGAMVAGLGLIGLTGLRRKVGR